MSDKRPILFATDGSPSAAEAPRRGPPFQQGPGPLTITYGRVGRPNTDEHEEYHTRFAPASHFARLRAECVAKRAIVELHAISLRGPWVNPVDGPAYSEWSCVLCDWCEVDGCDTLRALAQPYADHPDWNESWNV